MITVDAEGFTIGFEVGRRSYRELQHPALSYSLAKAVIASPEDAWRLTQKREREQTDAMDDGNILDSLLTAKDPYDPINYPTQQMTAPTKKATEPVSYCDWHGLRIIEAETLQTAAAKLAASTARAEDLTPVLMHKFVREVERANEMLVRMELAGFDRSQYHYQVSLYWTERARNGRRVQCRARLDFLKHDWTEVVDLKRTEDLSQIALERTVDRYKLALQAAAYCRAVSTLKENEQCNGFVPSWRWLFARTSPVVACTLRPADSMLLEAGEAAWNRAVNDWAEGLETGLWRGHESDHTPLMPTSWAIEQMDEDTST